MEGRYGVRALAPQRSRNPPPNRQRRSKRNFQQPCLVNDHRRIMSTSVFLTTEPRSDSETPLVVHLVYRFAIGGLENGLVNLINHMPPDRYRHTIVALTE